MRPESAGHRRALLIELRSSPLPAVHCSPMAYSCPLTLSHIKAACLGEPQDGRKGRMVGIREVESMSEGEAGGGVSLDGGIPYLLLRGCCSVV